jgi:malate dehydrogenase
VKITIVGAAGGIGSSVAYTLAMSGTGDELVLVDPRPDVLQTHVWDLEQLRVSVRPFTVRAGAAEDIAASDVVVISASVPSRKGSPRIEFLAENLGITSEIASALAGNAAWPGVLIIATNPVDPLVTDLQRVTGIDRRRVLGYTNNDTLRFRYAIAKALGVPPDLVTGWVLGEHGDRCVPLFDRIQVAGEPVTLSEADRAAVHRYLLAWYPRWVDLGVARTSTWTSGHGIASMIGAVISGGQTWPASVVLDGEFGISGVAVGVPVRLGPAGAEEILAWDLSPSQRAGMHAGAAFVSDALRAVAGQSPSPSRFEPRSS